MTLVLVVVLTCVIAYVALLIGSAIATQALSKGPTLPQNDPLRAASFEVRADVTPVRAMEVVRAVAAEEGLRIGFEGPAQLILVPRFGPQPFGSVVSVWFGPSPAEKPDAPFTTLVTETKVIAQGIPIASTAGRGTVAAIQAALVAEAGNTAP